MLKRKTLTTLAIISIILLIGVFFRIDSFNLREVSDDENAYYQDQNELPYMYEMDSYYNYRLTRNYLDHGYLGDKKINGTEWDLHSYYPGVPMDYPPLIIYITAFIYKLINLFSQIPLLTVCYWLPAFIGPLCGIPAYFFVSRLTNDYGGLVAGILAVTAPFYFMRTVPGWFDTDMFNLIFPILVIWFFVEAIINKNTKKQFLFAGLSSFTMFLFSTAWNGWQYIFYVITFSSIVYIIWRKLKGKEIKKMSYIFGTFFIGTLALILIFTGYLNIVKVFNIFELAKIFSNQSSWNFWPDSYIAVLELRKPSINNILDRLGITISILGAFSFFVIAIILLKSNLKNYKIRINGFIYLLILFWSILSLLVVFRGIRFIMLLIPPLIIIIGVLVGISTDYLSRYLKKDNLIKFTSIILVIIIVFPVILNINESPNSTPYINDDIWNSAEWIHNNTDFNTVVITDWSYGHLFTSISNRPVLYDGRLGYIETVPIRQFLTSYPYGDKSPSISREYWINKGFSTDNESLSHGIFKMLATSGDSAYLTLYNYTKSDPKSVNILIDILGVDKPNAKEILINNYQLEENEALNLLKFTHPDNPNAFLILTTDKMLRSGHWVFDFGEWNFNYQKTVNYTYSVGNILINKTSFNTTNNVTMNLQTNEIKWNRKIPYSYTIIRDGSITKHYLDKSSTFSIFILLDEKKSVVIDKKFENSIFTKLVIEKSNSTTFRPIYENKKVIIWKTS